MDHLSEVHLSDYEEYEATDSCYLDGRYFNLVLGEFEGVSVTPLQVTIKHEVKTATWAGIIHPRVPNFIRVVVETETIRHAALLVIDFPAKRVVFWNPVAARETANDDNLVSIIKSLLKKLMENVGRFRLHCSNYDVVPEASTPKCPMKGHCNAYVIKYVLDCLDGVDYNGSDILKFSAAIEDKYKHLLTGDVEQEYFWGLGAGLIGGAIIGSALSRPRYPAYGYPAYGYPAYPRYYY